MLSRDPRVALVDELPHTNIPGSRNTKRRATPTKIPMVTMLLGSAIVSVWTGGVENQFNSSEPTSVVPATSLHCASWPSYGLQR